MAIEEGSSSNYVSDYHRYELAVTASAQDNQNEFIFPQDELTPGHMFDLKELPFAIKIEAYYGNCAIVQRPGLSLDGAVHGMLVANEMKPASLLPEEEKNRAGIIFSVSRAELGIDGRYAVFEDMPIDQHIKAGGLEYTVALRRKRTVLPFEVELIKFEKQMYPGTDKPRSFQSEVILKDGKLQWHSLISMNNPLRYKGYTFYQSSFIQDDDATEGSEKPVTVLAVVKNIGAIFPYIASLTICLGMLIHLLVRIPKLRKPESRT